MKFDVIQNITPTLPIVTMDQNKPSLTAQSTTDQFPNNQFSTDPSFTNHSPPAAFRPVARKFNSRGIVLSRLSV